MVVRGKKLFCNGWAHWDHSSGVPDFPGVPVLVTAAEHRYIDKGGWVTVAAQSIDRSLLQDYAFDGGPISASIILTICMAMGLW